MKKTLFYGGFAAAAALAVSGAVVAQQTQEITYTTADLGSGVYMLIGAGGNIGFSVGDDGIFVIDDQFDRNAEGVLTEIRKISDKPIFFVANTHWHGDHTGGNAKMADEGALIVAHDNVRKRMKTAQSIKGELMPTALPVITFSDSSTFHWNGQTIHAFHQPNAHTDGDTMIHFKEANIIHMGDTLFAGRYPYIDLKSGGTVDGYIANLESVAAMADAETKIIPGHGPLSTADDLTALAVVLKDAKALVKELVDKGMSEDDIVAADPLKAYNEKYAWGFITGERMTRTLVQDMAAKATDE